jgi:hypothetical protein
LAEDQTVIKTEYTEWSKRGLDRSWGDLTLTARDLSFTWDGSVPMSEDASSKAKQILVEQAAKRQNSFQIPVDAIEAVLKPKGLGLLGMDLGKMEVVTAERTYRVGSRKRWSQPIRDAVEALGKTVIDEPDGKGWRVI